MESDVKSNSGSLRFRSAPSSLFVNFTFDSSDCLSPSPGLSSNGGDNSNPIAEDLGGNTDKYVGNGGYFVNSQLPPHYPRQSSATQSMGVDGCYGVAGSPTGMDHHNNQVKNGSGLMRQSSSPAGLFSHLTPHNNGGGYPGMKNQMSYSSGIPSSLGILLPQISEINGSETTETCVHDDDVKPGNGNGSDTRFCSSPYPFSSWISTSSQNFSALKRDLDIDDEGELGNNNTNMLLSHHLSVPKTPSPEMAALEKLLHFQDSVPCKIRAKRGCATHPRSIAERVRRTRISKGMRKLQELVPNMDKQTNTADMLELAVKYIKDLQKQYKTLSENRRNCKCLNLQKSLKNQMV